MFKKESIIIRRLLETIYLELQTLRRFKAGIVHWHY